MAFSPDGTMLATASYDGTVRLWNVADRRSAGPSLVPVGDGGVTGLAFSPDGKLLATAADKYVQLWDVARRQAHGDAFEFYYSAHAVAFSPDGKTLAAAGTDRVPDGALANHVRLWDVATRRAVGAPLVGHTDSAWSIAFSPDGRTLATGSNDGTVRLWDVVRHRAQGQPLSGQDGEVGDVAFSPDGHALASTGQDGTVRLWDVATGQPLAPALTGHRGRVNSVAFSRDGTLASAGDDETVRLWAPVLWQSGFGGLQKLVCAHVRRNLTPQQWQLYLPGQPYHKTCPGYPV
jgi:WD40 repeat protein